jgi:hypothetical protein
VGARGCNPPGPPDETRARRPGLEHIEAFCRYYERSPEELGLIQWRDTPTSDRQVALSDGQDSTIDRDETGDDPNQEQLMLAWLRESAVGVATVVLRSLARCPIKLTGVNDSPGGEDDTPPLAGVD